MVSETTPDVTEATGGAHSLESLYVLPLSMVPLETVGLKRARLIKNAALKGVIEVFDNFQSGSGQFEISAVPVHFSLPTAPKHPDVVMLERLAEMESFDLYSLRVLLRRNGIAVRNQKDLQLPADKKDELAKYMTSFTRPLMTLVYGESASDAKDFEELLRMFRRPDGQHARERLKDMAKKLDVPVMELPTFLEDHADTFLSMSYYTECNIHIQSLVASFLKTISLFKSVPGWRDICAEMDTTTRSLIRSVDSRIEDFDRSTETMWDNISAESFRETRTLIGKYHSAIGSILCGLTVKMNWWGRHFPDMNTQGASKRAEAMLLEMRQGLVYIKGFDDTLPTFATLKRS